MNTLIIPDIHLAHERAEEIIKKELPDKVIFLGDYFDDFGDDPHQVRETAEWFVHSVHNPNRIHLWGNHDVHYGFKYGNVRCSGYQQWKEFLIDEYVTEKEWNKLKFFHVLDDKWLLTHAGLHKSYLNTYAPDIAKIYKNRPEFIKKLTEFLTDQSIISIRKIARNEQHWLTGAGHARGGLFNVGGIIWCDIREFYPITGLNQIFGHTPSKHPRWINYNGKEVKLVVDERFTPSPDDVEKSFNLCLDTHTTNYAIWNDVDKTLRVKHTKDL